MQLSTVLIIILILAAIITLLTNYFEKQRELKNINEKMDKTPFLDINFDTIKNGELDKIELQELKKIYIQLIDIENKIDKTERHLNEIKFCIQLMTFFIIVPMIIKLLAAVIGYDLLSTL